jgi:hypothetical protein
MGWLIVTLAAVAVTFAAAFTISGEIWDAMFSAAVPVCLFLAGLLARATRTSMTPRQRVVVLSAAAILIFGVAGHWAVMHSMTRLQHKEILEIHDRVERGQMMSAAYDRATPVFAAFHLQRFPENKSMTEVFQQYYPVLPERGGPVMLDSLYDGTKVFARSAWNTTVVLTVVCGVGQGIDPEFRNVDGRRGMLQALLRVTPEGMVYEYQN